MLLCNVVYFFFIVYLFYVHKTFVFITRKSLIKYSRENEAGRVDV